jgi:hypothetical protein
VQVAPALALAFVAKVVIVGTVVSTPSSTVAVAEACVPFASVTVRV